MGSSAVFVVYLVFVLGVVGHQEVILEKLEDIKQAISRLDQKISDSSDSLKVDLKTEVREAIRQALSDASLCQGSLATTKVPVVTIPPTTTPRPPVAERIIVSPSDYHVAHFSQIALPGHNVSRYSYLDITDVTAMAYVYRTRRLLIGTKSPKIFTAEIDDANKSIFLDDVLTYGMTVDDSRNLVFLSVWNYNNQDRICKASADGTNFQTVLTLVRPYHVPLAIAVNPIAETIFVCNDYRVYMLNYDGSGLRSLGGNKGWLYAVALDVPNNFLYYSNSTSIVKIDVSLQVSTVVATQAAMINSLVVYHGELYYSTCRNSIIGRVDLAKSSTEEIARLEGRAYDECLLMCLVT